MALNDKQRRFVIEYPIDMKGDAAAIRAGYGAKNAASQASLLLGNLEVWEAVSEQIRQLAAMKALTPDWIMDQWRQIAMADPMEACYIRIECCRYCHGLNHEYQWTQVEYDQHLADVRNHVCRPSCEQPCAKTIPQMALGGFGFSPLVDPHPECPKCFGDGVPKVILSDSKKLTGPARRLVAGIKQTMYGVEIKFRDQDKALENMARVMGMMVERREHSGPNGGPIPVVTAKAEDFDDDQLATIIERKGLPE